MSNWRYLDIMKTDILTKYNKYLILKLYLNYQIVTWRQIRCLLAITDYSFYKMKMKHRVFDKINMGLSLSFWILKEENKIYLERTISHVIARFANSVVLCYLRRITYCWTVKQDSKMNTLVCLFLVTCGTCKCNPRMSLRLEAGPSWMEAEDWQQMQAWSWKEGDVHTPSAQRCGKGG